MKKVANLSDLMLLRARRASCRTVNRQMAAYAVVNIVLRRRDPEL
jgi:hypothetical protein